MNKWACFIVWISVHEIKIRTISGRTTIKQNHENEFHIFWDKIIFITFTISQNFNTFFVTEF